MPYFFTIIGVLIVINFYLLMKRSMKQRDAGKKFKADREARIKRNAMLIRSLEFEQEDAVKRIELRKKTLDLYDQVRLKWGLEEDS